ARDATRRTISAANKELEALPETVPARGPDRPAAERLIAALTSVLAENPLGPPSLIETAKSLAAAATESLKAKKEGAHDLWTSAARIIERFRASALAPEVVLRLGELVPKAIEREKADHANAIAALTACADSAEAGDLEALARGLFAFKLAI